MEKKNVFCLLFVAFLLLKGTCAYAEVYNGTCGEHLTYSIDTEDSTLVISGRGDMSGICFGNQYFRNAIKTVVFPEGLTSISSTAFAYRFGACDNLESISFPDSVVSIGSAAFWGSRKLKEVHFGKGLKSIGDSAFYRCTSLLHLEFPDSLESIGTQAFLGCDALSDTVIFPEGLKSIGSRAFNAWTVGGETPATAIAVWNARHCRSFGYPLSYFSGIVFGDKVEYIGTALCAYIMPMDSIVLPESVQSIDAYAFEHCSYLKHIELPHSLTSIGENAFLSDTLLQSITIPEHVSVIPDQMCGGCKSLHSVVLPEGLTAIEGYAFSNCDSLISLTIPSTVQSIGEGAFWSCDALESLTIPEGVTQIQYNTFRDCVAMKQINIPQSVTTIGLSAFMNSGLETVSLPSKLAIIGEKAFQNVTHLENLEIPDETRQIKSNAFAGCSALKEVQFGKKTAMIDAEAFKNDSLITEIRSRAAYPPLVQSSTFAGVPDSTWLFVPVQSIAAYREDPVWGRFRMPKEEEINYVTVDAAETTADFTWPTDSAAHSYQIDIYKDGAVFCKLTLGNHGQLLGISFSAPGRKMTNEQSTITNDESQPYTLSFKVTGLDEASRYNYVLSTLDANGTPLHVYIGDFATTGYQGELQGDGLEVIPTPPIIPSNPEAQTPTGVEETEEEQCPNGVVLQNGQLLIRRDGKTYSVTGQIVH